jgi:hypothetical protein
MEQNKALSYIHKTRYYGEGDLRIGTTCALSPDIYGLTFISMMDDAHIMSIIDVETGNLIPDDEREAFGEIMLNENQISEAADSLDLEQDHFVLNQDGERVSYNGEPLKLKNLIRKINLLNTKRRKYFQLNALCIYMQGLILY